MDRKRYMERQKEWDRFAEWESRQKTVLPLSKKLKLAGAWVDFILSRSPIPKSAPDIRGIKEMRRRLSVIHCAR